MFARTLASIAILLGFALPAFAQLPWQFKWQKGQTLNYKIKQSTDMIEKLDKGTNTSSSQMDAINRWQVSDLDAKGIATLSMTLVSLRHEQKRVNGDTLLFDSQNLDKSTPELRDQMSKYVGQVQAVLRVDGYGRVIDVKQGSAATFDWQPPFVIVFPEAKAAVGQAWKRPFNLVLDPPYGTGEKYDAEQRYDCVKLDGGKATLTVKTEFKTMPDNSRERLPLLQKDIQGELLFDLNAGRLVSTRLRTDKTVENHQGPGTSYRFKSDYLRELTD